MSKMNTEYQFPSSLCLLSFVIDFSDKKRIFLVENAFNINKLPLESNENIYFWPS